MGRYDNTKRNQYNSTPRKVFDTYIDRMAVKRTRDREQVRADVGALFSRIENLEKSLTLLNVQIYQLYHVVHDEDLDHDTEELE